MDFVGARWYKCDFHLHTMKSECYSNHEDTPEQWMDEVQKKGLNCIAITDHNDYRSINRMKKLGEERNVVVFPGVEITCDTSKVHILVLFDPTKTEDNVRDLLSRLDIDTEQIGKNVGTKTNCLDVCKIAKEKGALVIAAHIDEFSGISSLSADTVEKILNRKYIDAVQVVNGDIWDAHKGERDKSGILKDLYDRYRVNISQDEAEKWRKTYDKVKKAEIPMIVSSDNPCEEHESHHGLWGIGKRYTWMKMDKNPNLESIRQALLSKDMRVKLDSEGNPESLPDLWIKSISIYNTIINPKSPIKINFNPQLNSIIGGRGSGKSSIIRMIAGGLNSIDAYVTGEIKAEQESFYKQISKKDKTGIFNEKSYFEILLYRNSILYKVVVKNIKNSNSHERILYKYNDEIEDWESVTDENFFDFMKVQVYTQKQIYQIAKDPDALLKLIDQDIEGLEDEMHNREALHSALLNKLADIRNVNTIISNQSKIESELKDYSDQIEGYKKSRIATLLNSKQKIQYEEKVTIDYMKENSLIIQKFDELFSKIEVPSIDEEKLTDAKELNTLLQENRTVTLQKISEIKTIISDMKKLNDQLAEEIKKTEWFSNQTQNTIEYNNACSELQNIGVSANKLDDLLEQQKKKEEELASIKKLKSKLLELDDEKQAILKDYITSFDKIRKMRTDFISSILHDHDNVKIEVLEYSNRASFENMIKNLTQKDGTTILEDINTLEKFIFERKDFNAYQQVIKNIRDNKEDKTVSAVFKRTIKSMEEDQIDKMLMFCPEDELRVSYKPEGAKKFISLSTASAGQKTTAILTFILAYGNKPLLLDQPEDDLDNRLVYDLVVRRLKLAKQNRQIIVVTHNANIPVNGDSEYIISMSSESKYVETKYTGTLDSENLRKEICDVMEGTEYAFEMRAKKYHFKIVE